MLSIISLAVSLESSTLVLDAKVLELVFSLSSPYHPSTLVSKCAYVALPYNGEHVGIADQGTLAWFGALLSRYLQDVYGTVAWQVYGW